MEISGCGNLMQPQPYKKKLRRRKANFVIYSTQKNDEAFRVFYQNQYSMKFSLRNIRAQL